MELEGLDQWRNFFRGADANIFEIIENAIMVAAKDDPEEFRRRRIQIVEKTFSCQFAQCCSRRQTDLSQPEKSSSKQDPKEQFESKADSTEKSKNINAGDKSRTAACGGKESPTDNICSDEKKATDFNQLPSKNSYRQTEALADELDQEKKMIKEVHRIKELLLLHSTEEPADERLLHECLTWLDLLDVSYALLEETLIGKAVRPLRKHKSRQISEFADSIIRKWRRKVEETLQENDEPTTDRSLVSYPPVCDEEGGLPAPPLDEDFLFRRQLPMEFNDQKFFDYIDDNGNILLCPKENEENLAVDAKVSDTETGATGLLKPNMVTAPEFQRKEVIYPTQKKMKGLDEIDHVPKKCSESTKQQQDGRQLQNGANAAGKPQEMPSDLGSRSHILKEPETHRRPDAVVEASRQADKQERLRLQEDNDINEARLEAATRRLKESYLQLQKAKRQRTTQLMELHQIPKETLGPRRRHVKHRTHKRSLAN